MRSHHPDDAEIWVNRRRWSEKHCGQTSQTSRSRFAGIDLGLVDRVLEQLDKKIDGTHAATCLARSARSNWKGTLWVSDQVAVAITRREMIRFQQLDLAWRTRGLESTSHSVGFES